MCVCTCVFVSKRRCRCMDGWIDEQLFSLSSRNEQYILLYSKQKLAHINYRPSYSRLASIGYTDCIVHIINEQVQRNTCMYPHNSTALTFGNRSKWMTAKDNQKTFHYQEFTYLQNTRTNFTLQIEVSLKSLAQNSHSNQCIFYAGLFTATFTYRKCA